MFTTSPHLDTRRPSPTAVEFTVSTLPRLTLACRTALHLVNLARLLVGLGVVLVVYARWTLSPYYYFSNNNNSNNSSSGTTASLNDPARLRTLGAALQHCALQLMGSSPGRLALHVAETTSAWLLLPLAAVLLYLVLRRMHTEERLLVLRGLGIQTSSTPSTVLGTAVTRFIPTDKIQDVLINEAFLGFEVRYCLVVVVDDEEDVVVVFPKLLPRRAVVERVWRGVRGCLYEDQGRGGWDEKI
jgi:phosphatidylinositol N-acetylglucosaminyltransferase subunit H